VQYNAVVFADGENFLHAGIDGGGSLNDLAGVPRRLTSS
jgi:hypothetical protein